MLCRNYYFICLKGGNLFKDILERRSLYLFSLLALLFLLASCSTVDTDNSVSRTEDEKIRTSDTSNVLELKAKIDELNNKIYVMNEQMEGLRARLRDEKLPVKTLAKKNTQDLSAEQKIVQEFVGGTAAINKITHKSTNVMYKNYLSAYEFFKEKQYARSLIAFSSFIDQYPDTVLTDNAYFWLAESYYQKKEYVLAIQEYLKILENFPDGSKAPYAVLKLSNAYEMVGDKTSSEKYKRSLFQKYPKSMAASISISANNFGG